MDFAYSARTEELRARVQNFMNAMNATIHLPILHGANIPLIVRKFRVAPAYSAVSPNIKEQFDV